MERSARIVVGILRVRKQILRPDIGIRVSSGLGCWVRHGGSALSRRVQGRAQEAGSQWSSRFLDWHCNERFASQRFYHGTKTKLTLKQCKAPACLGACTELRGWRSTRSCTSWYPTRFSATRGHSGVLVSVWRGKCSRVTPTLWRSGETVASGRAKWEAQCTDAARRACT
jgi:hypothetical protein